MFHNFETALHIFHKNAIKKAFRGKAFLFELIFGLSKMPSPNQGVFHKSETSYFNQTIFYFRKMEDKNLSKIIIFFHNSEKP